MSKKARDGQGRWRSKTIAFRISPEENDLLKECVRLSGLTKQDYVINRVLARDITILPNPRVHRALREKMEQLCEEIGKIQTTEEISPEMLAVLHLLAKIYDGLTNEKQGA